MFIRPLDVEFAESDLRILQSEIWQFHKQYREMISNSFSRGTTPITPELGYYIPYFEPTYKERNVSSWKEIIDLDLGQIKLSTIRMLLSQRPDHYQNLCVVYNKEHFSKNFEVVLNRILDSIPFKFQRESASFTVQEMGYSMKFHTDAGVDSRIHVVLNQSGLDYFYTTDGTYKMEFGNCCLIQASKTMHGFMSFSQELRIHLILDVI